MKGMCPICKEIVDETQFNMEAQMCEECWERSKVDRIIYVKYSRIVVVIGNKDYHYVCTHAVWNWWLDRYYPLAELTMIVEHIEK